MAEWRRASSDRLGEEVGTGWILESVIGSGGTATVYRARGANGREAAVKLMHAHLVGNWSRRFEREARLLSQLTEPSVVRLYEFGRKQGVPFLVLELLEGDSLDRVELPAKLSARVQAIATYARQALRALEAVHACGVLHRDLKPSNLFLTKEGVLKVLDFGAACSDQQDLAKPDSLTSGLLGTPAFMSPEQARGRWDLVDERADIWSLAATLFTLLSGEHVHPGRTRNEQLGRAMSASARSVLSVLPRMAPAFARILDQALSYRREDRFQSAAAFRQALEGQSQPRLAVVRAQPLAESTLRRLAAVPQRRALSRAPGMSALALGVLLVADAGTHHQALTMRNHALLAQELVPQPSAPAISPSALPVTAVQRLAEPQVLTKAKEQAKRTPEPSRRIASVNGTNSTIVLAATPASSAAASAAPPTSSTNALDLRLGAKERKLAVALSSAAPATALPTTFEQTALDVRN